MNQPNALSALDTQTPPLPLAVFHLRGTQSEMGAQHGRLLQQIGGWQATAAYYPNMVGQMLRGSALSPVERHWPAVVKPLLDLLAARLERHRPADLRARTDAFMRAAGQGPGAARHVLAMDMFQNAVGLAGMHKLGPFADPWQQRAVPACSTLMAWGAATEDGRLLHARNFDFPGVGIWDMAPAVVFCTPDRGQRYAFATSRGADVPGITAWNESGLTVTAHTRLHRDVSFSGAAIVDLCHDIARKAVTLADAEAIARERPVASTWGLAISSGVQQRAVVIECHATDVAVTGPEGAEPWRTCTNHYLAEQLRPRELAPSPGWSWHTHSRKKRLETAAHAAVAGEPFDVAALFGWLGDGRDADVPEMERVAGGVVAQATSVQSVVVDPQRQMLHLSVGRCPSGRGAALAVPWDWSAPVGVEQRPLDAAVRHAPVSRFEHGEAQTAYRHYLRAAQLEAQGAGIALVHEHLTIAAGTLPDEPTLQLLAGAVALREDDVPRALALFERGLQSEKSPFAQGRLHMWASRAAAHVPDHVRAAHHRDALAQLRHPLLPILQERVAAEVKKPYPLARLRGIALHTLLGDIG